MIKNEKLEDDIQNKIEEVGIEVEKKENKKESDDQKWEKLENTKDNKTKKFNNFILSYYVQFCIQKGITKITVDSYTKFINHEMGNTIVYSDNFSVYEYFDTW